MKVPCPNCNTIVNRKPSYLKKWKAYCSLECQRTFKRKGSYAICLTCSKEIYRTLSEIEQDIKHFCSQSCAVSATNKLRIGENHPLFKGGGSQYRQKAILNLPHVCANLECPLIAANIPLPLILLDVDHIDSNRSNNDIENLQFLCVYCHAIKTRKVNFINE